jgi:Lar family restriction alleviation protein
MNHIELKPCPFCGGTAIMRENNNSFVPRRYYVRCGNDNCSVIVTTCNRDTETEAAEAWNKRVTE